MSRELPQAIEIEKKLLSAMMLKEGRVIPQVSTILKAEDFYRVEHRLIYRAMLKVYAQGSPPDIFLIEEELTRTGDLPRVKHNYLFSLIDYEFTTARATAQATTIKNKAILRRLIETCEDIIENAYDEQKSVEEIVEVAEKKIFSVTSKTNAAGFEKLSTIILRAYDRIDRIKKNPDEIEGVKTKLIGLDKILNGLHKTDLILLAARPSMGKTALALNIAANAATTGKTVAIFSLEMSRGQLANRLLSTASRVNSQKLNTGHDLGDDDMDKLIVAADELSRLNLYIDDTAGLTMLEMRSKLRRLKQEAGLDLAVIDYLQLMQGGRQENRQQEISEISRSLKSLARELDVPILALSQLSRSVEMRAEKKPQLSDLRESGSLEQDADIVLFLYRDEYYNKNDENENIAELIIAKNRNGPTTAIHLQFQKEIMRFGDLVKESL